MKRIILGIVCILFSGYAYADVFHPEDATIRGHIGFYGDDVCFNNNGSTDSSNCPDDGGTPNEGYVYASPSGWVSDPPGINGCGITAVDPVSGAVCPLVTNGSTIAPCTDDQYLLVQTLGSGHYFAVKAATCSTFNRPEAEVIFPCLSTDAFDTVNGCVPTSVVAHPENPDIVGLVDGAFVCFNNDGAIASTNECNVSSVDEGFVALFGAWAGGSDSGINGCGVSAVNPVSSATCPLSKGPSPFASCTNNEYVLVQTTKSGHFWAVKTNGSCDGIATPAATGLVPCRATDSFDPVLGCTGVTNQSGLRVEGSYIQLETSTVPSVEHCNDTSHEGRMVVDSVNDLLYICTGSGWTYTSLTPTP